MNKATTWIRITVNSYIKYFDEITFTINVLFGFILLIKSFPDSSHIIGGIMSLMNSIFLLFKKWKDKCEQEPPPKSKKEDAFEELVDPRK